jgi:hypothetical protein
MRTTFLHCFLSKCAFLMGMPHLCIACRHGYGAAMCSRGVLVHCPSCLCAAIAALTAELPCGDGVFTKWALELAKAVHHCDGVISHSFSIVACTCITPNQSYPPPMLVRDQARNTESKQHLH